MPQVRRATEADREFVVRAQLAMALESEGLTLSPGTVQEGVRGVLERPERGFYLIAEVDGVACGCMLVLGEWSDWRSREVWWLHSVYVTPERRREGLFRALYAYVTELGKRHGVAGLRLYVDRRNERAKAVYRALGMTDEHYEMFEHMFHTEAVPEVPLNPTAEQLRAWAYKPDRKGPVDFDLMLAHDAHLHEAILQMAADPACPARRFMLGTLYIVSGDSVRTAFRSLRRPHLESLLRAAEILGEPLTTLWARRTRRLIAHPETFEYDYWCTGDAARDDDTLPPAL